MGGIDKQIPGENPGLLFVPSKITKPDQVSHEQYMRWYDEVHIPDILKSGGMKEASRWEALDPNDERPYLALYPLGDLDFVHTDEYKAIPLHHDSLPGSHAIFDFADFDTRFYKSVQLYEPESAKSDQPDLVIAAGFTPADDEDYDKWYRQEHLKDVSGITGWRRTARYALTSAGQNHKAPEDKQLAEPPKFLTLHYFDGESLPAQELEEAGKSEWTKKNMSTMKESKIAVFKKHSQWSK